MVLQSQDGFRIPLLKDVLEALPVAITVGIDHISLVFQRESLAGLEEQQQVLASVVNLTLRVALHHAPAITAAERVTHHVEGALAMALSP